MGMAHLLEDEHGPGDPYSTDFAISGVRMRYDRYLSGCPRQRPSLGPREDDRRLRTRAAARADGPAGTRLQVRPRFHRPGLAGTLERRARAQPRPVDDGRG